MVCASRYPFADESQLGRAAIVVQTTPHTHGDKSQPQSQLSPNQFSSTRLHILGKLVSGEVVTAAGELNLTRVRCAVAASLLPYRSFFPARFWA